MVFKFNPHAYFMEAAGLAGFVLLAGVLSVLLEHPDLPVTKSTLKNYPTLRRVPLGVIMGAYISVVILFTGKKSAPILTPQLPGLFTGSIKLIVRMHGFTRLHNL